MKVDAPHSKMFAHLKTLQRLAKAVCGSTSCRSEFEMKMYFWWNLVLISGKSLIFDYQSTFQNVMF
jgi:hypothetical protein